MSIHVPSEWNKVETILPADVVAYLSEGKRKEVSARTLHFSTFFIHRVWEMIPPSCTYLCELGGQAITTRSSKDQANAVLRLTNHLTYGMKNGLPSEVVHRALGARYQYGQCLKQGHYLQVSPLCGIQTAVFATELSHLPNLHYDYLEKFVDGHQVGICTEHDEATCVTCHTDFRVLEQDSRFWLSASEECQPCLQSQLMYVTPKHNVAALMVKKGKRRAVYKMNEWGIEPVSVPLGPATPSPDVSAPTVSSILYGSPFTLDLNGNIATTPTYIEPEPWPPEPASWEDPNDE